MEKPVFIKISDDIMIVCKKELASAMSELEPEVQLKIGKMAARFFLCTIISTGGKNREKNITVLSEIEKWMEKVELESKEEFGS